MTTAWILWCVLLGAIGFGFLTYGFRQRAPVPLLCGFMLLLFPYFISNAIALAVVGLALVVTPYFIRI